MPYKDRERQLRAKRNCSRSKRHGKNWRQIVYDCNCMCTVCGSTEYLEFHAPEGEENPSRTLLCWKCHKDTIEYPSSIEVNYHLSHLIDDIDLEIADSGGMEAWRQKYRVVASE